MNRSSLFAAKAIVALAVCLPAATLGSTGSSKAADELDRQLPPRPDARDAAAVRKWESDCVTTLERLKEADPQREQNKQMYQAALARGGGVLGKAGEMPCAGCGKATFHYWFEDRWSCSVCELCIQPHQVLKRPDGMTFFDFAQQRQKLYDDKIAAIRAEVKGALERGDWQRPAPPAPPPAPPQTLHEFYVTRLSADKEEYAIGEPVELTVELERWADVRQSDGSMMSQFQEKVDACTFDLTFSFPASSVTYPPVVMQVPRGKPRLRPFAPIVPGEYTIEALPAMLGPQKETYYAANQAAHGNDMALRASVTFRCVDLDTAQRASLDGRIAQVIARYRQEIPSNRAAVRAKLDEELRNKQLVPFVEPVLTIDNFVIADMEYGSFNNALFGDNRFTCHSYSGQVLEFLNRLHFRGPNRQLFVGVHYGPIFRGFRSPALPQLFGEHYGVVIYPAGIAYDDDGNRVLDPWPRQTPDVFSLKDFRWFYGWWFAAGAAVGVAPDPSRASWFQETSFISGTNDRAAAGFPTHGSPVYWNNDWLPWLSPRAEPVALSGRPIGPATPPLPRDYYLLMCPATLTISDAQGRYAGLHEGKLACTIPQCELFGYQKADGDYAWCVGLPPGEYDLRVTGTGRGAFRLLVAADGKAAQYYAAPINRGETASLHVTPGTVDAPLTLADGRRIPPRIFRPAPPAAVALTEAQAVAALKQLGGVLIHYDDRLPERPAILVDCINHPQFEDNWLRFVAALPHLHSLALSGTAVTDRGLTHLKNLAKLETLLLNETRVTDRGLAELAAIKSLRYLDVRVTPVTVGGIAALRSANPALEIEHDLVPEGVASPPSVTATAAGDSPPPMLSADADDAPKSRIQAIRQKVMELSFPEEACEEWQDEEDGDDEEPEGWSKSPIDPTQLVALFPTLRLRKGYVLRAYIFREGGNGNGVVWAMPADADFPEPDDCPKLENHLLKAPKPWDALDDVMEAIEGDGSEWSYLAASLLRRELGDFGARWHGVSWGFHTVLEEDPFRGGPADEFDPGLDRPRTPLPQWKWNEPQPHTWAPQVRIEGDRVTVTFYTFCGLETERIYRHTDTYRTGKYRARVEEKAIGTGGPGFLP